MTARSHLKEGERYRVRKGGREREGARERGCERERVRGRRAKNQKSIYKHNNKYSDC